MTETIIKWNVSGIFKADANKCYQEIQDIGEEVKPEQVLDKARDSGTELHKCFDWDDSSAAEKYRMYQARNVIRNLIVVTREIDNDEEKQPIQFRVMMKNENERGSTYKQTIKMVQDENEYQKLLEQAYQELHAFKMKYQCLTELSEIIALID